MGNTEKCLVEGCNGVYVNKVLDVITIERKNGKKKEINVTQSICNQCGDDQDGRLVKFIRENL